MFHGCTSLTEVKITPWNVKNVKTMQNMFAYCTNQNLLHYATKLDISGC